MTSCCSATSGRPPRPVRGHPEGDPNALADARGGDAGQRLQPVDLQPVDLLAFDLFSPSIFSPSIFSPSIFSPSIFSPSIFSPSLFSPAIFSPSIFSPSIFSPSIFSPSIFSPSIFSPSEFSPSIFSPSIFSPSVPISDEEDYEYAQIVSLLALSANDATADEHILQDTWNNTGYFYIRVGGRNGTYDPGAKFNLSVNVNQGVCGGVAPSNAPLLNASYTIPTGLKSLILSNTTRMTDDGHLAQMQSDLQTFAGLSSVDGTIVDVGTLSPRVAALETQADANSDCPYAENLVAESIRDVVTAVRQANPGLQYIVLVGNDHAIPFFRYPDNAGNRAGEHLRAAGARHDRSRSRAWRRTTTSSPRTPTAPRRRSTSREWTCRSPTCRSGAWWRRRPRSTGCCRPT